MPRPGEYTHEKDVCRQSASDRQMEGHEARVAQAALDGNLIEGSERSLRVRFEDSRGGRGRKRR